ncbi:hypothetical protein [Maioricimonas sp. JC845]|uniref:hypothetical protein n=1 Tax=Maioricimonas sp. JC845 TaxID=3232138 RepID=UPI00345AD590
MFERLCTMFGAQRAEDIDIPPSDPNGIPVRFKVYTNRLHLDDTSGLAFAGKGRDAVRQAIPFLADHEEMETRRVSVAAAEADPAWGPADEIHIFKRDGNRYTSITSIHMQKGLVVFIRSAATKKKYG